MIYDELSSLANYIPLIDGLSVVLTILGSKQWKDESVGSHICANSQIVYNLVEYESYAEPKPYEVYKDKTQVHILLAGEELMALSWREHARSIGFDQKGRATLSADPIGVIHAKADHFTLFMPGEPHTVGMETSPKGSFVRKLIFTIPD